MNLFLKIGLLLALLFSPVLAVVPDAPVLVSPATNAVNQSIVVQLNWNSALTATSYRAQISAVVDFATTLMSDTAITDTFKVSSGIVGGTKYYWRVGAKNATGWSDYSVVDSFTTRAVPAAPAVMLPVTNALNQIITVTIKWHASATATSYNLQIDDAVNFGSPALSDTVATDTSRSALGIVGGTKYYWRVRGSNAGGYGSYSVIDSFTTLAVPAAPAHMLPATNALNQTLVPTMKWHVASTATAYRLQIDNSSGFGSAEMDSATITDTSLVAYGLSAGTKYYWHVKSQNSSGWGSYSGTDSFTTLAVPATPVKLFPRTNVTAQLVRPLIKWYAAARATTYKLQIDDAVNFGSAALDTTGADTAVTPACTLANATKYYWRVRGVNGNGAGTYAGIDSFTTILAVPDTTTLASPATNSRNAVQYQRLYWHPAARAVTYEAQVSALRSFATKIIDSTLIADTTVLCSTALNYGTRYYWQVRATNAGGNCRGWSVVDSFYVVRPCSLFFVQQDPNVRTILDGYVFQSDTILVGQAFYTAPYVSINFLVVGVDSAKVIFEGKIGTGSWYTTADTVTVPKFLNLSSRLRLDSMRVKTTTKADSGIIVRVMGATY